MKNSTPDFPPITPRQRSLLEEIKAENEKFRALPPGDPKTGIQVPEFYEIQKRIDELSVKALRSGLLRSRPAETRRPGFSLVFDSTGEYAEVLPRFADFHPELPHWVRNHFVEWIRMLRLRRHDAREVLRETKIVGIETGMKRPKDITLMMRVLELRGVITGSALAKESPLNYLAEMKVRENSSNPEIPYTLAELQEQLRNRMRVTAETLKNTKQQSKTHTEEKRKRTRKNFAPWNQVIVKLVEEGFLSKKISYQALKKRLRNIDPDYPWDMI